MSEAIRVHIRGLEVFGRHGVLPEETTLGQRFVVDLTAGLAECPGIDTDQIDDTLDYARLADDVAAIVSGAPSRLLEHLAGRIADQVLDEPRVAWVEVTVRKPHVAIPHTVAETAVTLRRDAGA